MSGRFDLMTTSTRFNIMLDILDYFGPIIFPLDQFQRSGITKVARIGIIMILPQKFST